MSYIVNLYIYTRIERRIDRNGFRSISVYLNRTLARAGSAAASSFPCEGRIGGTAFPWNPREKFKKNMRKSWKTMYKLECHDLLNVISRKNLLWIRVGKNEQSWALCFHHSQPILVTGRLSHPAGFLIANQHGYRQLLSATHGCKKSSV